MPRSSPGNVTALLSRSKSATLPCMTGARWRPGDPVDWERPGELWTAGGLHSFVVESKGARTGETRRAVLGYLEEGQDAWLVIGSMGGAPRNPAWVHNLEAEPSATVVS